MQELVENQRCPIEVRTHVIGFRLLGLLVKSIPNIVIRLFMFYR